MTQWHAFLTTQGAVIVDGQVGSYGAAEAERQAVAQGNSMADLSHLGLLQLSGDDAFGFLQGQVTNDVMQLDGSHSQYAGYCTPKGRLLALFLAFAHDGHLHLQLDRALVEAISKRLRMFVMRAKVVISDVSDSITAIGVAGPDSAALLQKLLGAVPEVEHGLLTLPQATILRLPGALPRFQVYTASAGAPELWQALAQHFTPVGKPGWDYLEIQAGIPEIVTATQEAFVPQMVNLDALGGINFKKGCYTGQEIVARTHYLGKVKRRTQLAHVDAPTQPQAGDPLLEAASGSEAGQVVRSAPAPQGGYALLAELRLDSVEAGLVQWQDSPLTLATLPYTLPAKA